MLAPGLIAGLLDLALAQSLRQLLRSLSLVGLVLLTTYKTVRDLAPSYLSDVIIPYIPSRVLRFQTSELRIHIVLPMRNNLFYSDQHRISLTLVLVVCSHKLQAVSLSCCPIPPPHLHSGSLLMDHGPLGTSTSPGSGSYHGLCWIIALLHISVFL